MSVAAMEHAMLDVMMKHRLATLHLIQRVVLIPVILTSIACQPAPMEIQRQIQRPAKSAMSRPNVLPRTRDDVMVLIHDLDPMPSGLNNVSFTKESWARYIRCAALLQKTDTIIVEWALEDYVTHYRTAFEENVDELSEWSKILLLLRVMFDLPDTAEKTQQRDPRGPMTFGGFSLMPLPSGESKPLMSSSPVKWTRTGPEFDFGFAGYNGPPYAGAEEYRYFLDNFEYRDLSSYVQVEGNFK